METKNEDLQAIKQRCTTVARELRRVGSQKVIDYVSLDVEGYELAVLKGID